jgi:hypothetical protein
MAFTTQTDSRESCALHIEDIQPGMVLATPVTDTNGRVLLQAGLTLRSEHQRQMRRRGIRIVYVSSASMPQQRVQITLPPAPLDLETNTQSDPFMKELLRLAYERRHLS